MVISWAAGWLSAKLLVAALSVMTRLPPTTLAVALAVAGVSRHSSDSRRGRKRQASADRGERRAPPRSHFERGRRRNIANLQ
jgi:hypothetical protein